MTKAAEHERRGTCEPGCPEYGRCHCGCNATTSTAEKTNRGLGRVQGRPAVYITGHNYRTEGGVDLERITPLIAWLRQRYPVRRIAELAGLPYHKMNHYAYGRADQIPPEYAARITELVLEHRRPANPLGIFEVEPAAISPEERDRRRREIAAEDRKRYRDGGGPVGHGKAAAGRGRAWTPLERVAR